MSSTRCINTDRGPQCLQQTIYTTVLLLKDKHMLKVEDVIKKALEAHQFKCKDKLICTALGQFSDAFSPHWVPSSSSDMSLKKEIHACKPFI